MKANSPKPETPNPEPETPTLSIDASNNVYAEGVKICRIDPRRKLLLFLDKDRRRCSRRGSNQVAVPIAELTKLAEPS